MSIPIWPGKDENPFGKDAELPHVEPPSDTPLELGDVLQQHDGDEPNFDKPLREEDFLPYPALSKLKHAVKELSRDQIAELYGHPLTDQEDKELKQNLTAHGGGLREDAGKLRYDLIPVYPMARLAEVYTLGCAKYADRNWEKGIAYANCMAALKRHLEKWWGGETEDPDGQHHLASVMFWAAALMEYELHETVPDERPKHD